MFRLLLEKVKDTQSNMEYAFEQENAVNGNYYPEMLKEADHYPFCDLDRDPVV